MFCLSEVQMKNPVFTSVLIVLLIFPAATAYAGAGNYGVDMTIRQIAHDTGMKGRELAELLNLEESVNKDKPLVELGISQQQLEKALEGLDLLEPEKEDKAFDINIRMTLQEAAHAMGITAQELAHDLNLPVDTDRQTPLEDLGVKEATLAQTVKHASHEGEEGLEWLKYPLWLVICGLAVYLLMKGRASKVLYLSTLAFSLAVTGFVLGKAPNPMESVSKIFKTAVGIYPDYMAKILAFLFFCALAVIGNKVICGWGCPFGALQELLFEIPMGGGVKRLRKKQLPFKVTNTLRALIFLLFALFVFGILGGKKGFVVYHYINPFNLFDLDFTLVTVVISIAAFIILSPFIYRSFCQFICPFGVISWLLEKISLIRVKIDRSKCTECMVCVETCPLEAMKGRMVEKQWPADCFSCARCLRSCRYGALDYKPVWGK